MSAIEEDYSCQKCGQIYELRGGDDPTRYCDHCAQELAETVDTLKTELFEWRLTFPNQKPQSVAADLLQKKFELDAWHDQFNPQLSRAVAEREALKAQLDATNRACAEMRKALEHDAPGSCWATGPLTGNPIEDLVVCPGCRALSSEAGKGYVSKEELAPTIEALEKLSGAVYQCEAFSRRVANEEIARLRKLMGEKEVE